MQKWRLDSFGSMVTDDYGTWRWGEDVDLLEKKMEQLEENNNKLMLLVIKMEHALADAADALEEAEKGDTIMSDGYFK